MVHGNWANSSGPLVEKVRNAVVENQLDVNLIAIDWMRYMNHNDGLHPYTCGVHFGNIVGGFLKEVSKWYGLDFGKLRLVGFSVGGGLIGPIGASLNGQAASLVSLQSCTYGTYAQFVEVS